MTIKTTSIMIIHIYKETATAMELRRIIVRNNVRGVWVGGGGGVKKCAIHFTERAGEGDG